MVIDLNYRVDISNGVLSQHAKQPMYYDDQYAHSINVSVFNGRNGIDLTGMSCVGYVTSERTGTTVGPITGSVSGNTCSVVLPHEAYVTSGAVKIEVKLIEGESVTTILSLIGHVSGRD